MFAFVGLCSAQAQQIPRDAASQMNLEFKEGRAKLVEKYDRNHNGKIDVDERRDFIDAVADLRIALHNKFSHDEHGKPIATPAMRQKFASLDKDANGKLDSKETIDSGRRGLPKKKTVSDATSKQ